MMAIFSLLIGMDSSTAFNRLPLLPADRSLLLLDPLVHALLEHIHWQGARSQYLIVKRAERELAAQLLTRFFAETENGELSDLVGKRLGRPGDVAIGLRLNSSFIQAGMGAEELKHLIARPMLPAVDSR